MQLLALEYVVCPAVGRLGGWGRVGRRGRVEISEERGEGVSEE